MLSAGTSSQCSVFQDSNSSLMETIAKLLHAAFDISAVSLQIMLDRLYQCVQDQWPWLLLVGATTIIFGYSISRNSKGSNPILPPGPRRWPIVGSIPAVIASGPQLHQSLAKLSQHYGSIMSLWLGEYYNVVISSPEAAREVLKSSDQFCYFSTLCANSTSPWLQW